MRKGPKSVVSAERCMSGFVTRGLLMVQKVIPSMRQHEGGKFSHDGICMEIQVYNHLIDLPPATNNFYGVVVYDVS